jgi:hypothetical protein
MKKLYALIVFLGLCVNASLAQDSTALKIAALEKSFTYQHGTIKNWRWYCHGNRSAGV